MAKISAPEKTTESDLTNLLNNKENSTDFRSTTKVSVTTEKQTAQIKEVVDEPENDIMEKDIKTYTRVITSEKEIEAEEPDHLLLAQEELKEAREEVFRLTAEIPLLEQKIESLKQEQQAEKDKIEALKPEKEKVNQAYVTAAQEATNSYDMLIAKAEQDYSSTLAKINNIDLAQYYKKNFKIPKFDEYGNDYLFNLPDILTEAHTLLEDTKGAVREIVSEAVKQVLEINEKMYTREISSEQQQEQVKKVHSDLIDHLKNITDEDLVSFSSHIQKYASYSGVMSLLRNIYKAYITNDACQQDICKMADTDCFVSNNGKRRDFLSPAPVPQRPLPSVREVVFFDYSDYDSIPVNNGRLTREGILNNMTYIPWIWKRILTSPAYLEKDIDLSTVIKPSEARLANSGKYPC